MQRLIRVLLVLALSGTAHAQDLFSMFVPSEPEDVQRMLRIAALRDGDVVFDLGSGDGRIVLGAAQMNVTVRGRGIEIDEKLVHKATAAAQAQGVADRVHFLHQNAFDADLREATVITMWLFPELMRMLRPKILAEALPGTRIVAKTWDLGTWKPDETDKEGWHVHLWVVPARVAGYWTWELPVGGLNRSYAAVLEQWFQAVEGVARVGNRRGVFDEVRLRGEEISFRLVMTVEGMGMVRHHFKGRARGDAIEGTVGIVVGNDEKEMELPWRAARVPASAYFAPTGTGAR